MIVLYFESENELKFYNLEAWIYTVFIKGYRNLKKSCTQWAYKVEYGNYVIIKGYRVYMQKYCLVLQLYYT